MNGETGDLWERGFLGDDVRQIETEGKALRGSSLGFSGSYRKSATYKTAKNVKLDEEVSRWKCKSKISPFHPRGGETGRMGVSLCQVFSFSCFPILTELILFY